MNKAIIVLSAIAFFLLGVLVFADVDTRDGTAIQDSTNLDGFTSNLDDADGQVIKASGGGESAPDFSDDFNRANEDPPTGWDELGDSNTWAIVSNTLEPGAGEEGASYSTNSSGATQYVCVQLVDGTGGAALRSTGTGSDGFYAVYDWSGDGNMYWDRFTDAGSQESIQSVALDPDANDYIGVTVQGTGNSTIVKIWDLGASPCQTYPTDKDNWCTGSDAADATLENNPTTAEDTGLRVGVAAYDNSGMTYDNWTGGALD